MVATQHLLSTVPGWSNMSKLFNTWWSGSRTFCPNDILSEWHFSENVFHQQEFVGSCEQVKRYYHGRRQRGAGGPCPLPLDFHTCFSLLPASPHPPNPEIFLPTPLDTIPAIPDTFFNPNSDRLHWYNHKNLSLFFRKTGNFQTRVKIRFNFYWINFLII